MGRWPEATVETDPIAEADLAAHEAATTDVHGTGVNITADNIASYAAGAADASTTVKGVSKLSVVPASGTNPIAVGDNDPRNADQRTPVDGSVTAAKINTALKPSGSATTSDEALRALGSGSTQAAAGDDSRFPSTGQKNALAGSSGTPGTANKYVTEQDASNSNARTPTAHAASHGSGGSDAVTLAESQVTGLVADLAGKQPLDSDLTAIAALSTTTFGRALLELADAAAGRTAFGLGTAATQASTAFDAAGAAASAQAASQPLDSDLTALAALSTTAFGRSFLELADAAAARTLTGAAPLASPALTGTPTVPTAAQGTNTTQAASTAYVQTEVGLLIPKSLVDAKGDLLVGTADNTVARKAVGTNGFALVGDSSSSDGLAYSARGLPVGSGRYLQPAITALSPSSQAAGTILAGPIFVPARQTFDRITCNITATATGNVRLLIYDCGTNGLPNNKVLDAGTADVSTAVAKAITINQSLAAGIYFLALQVETTAGTVAFTISGSSAINVIGNAAPAIPGATNPSIAFIRTGMTIGSPPDPFGTPNFDQVAGQPMMALRAA